jgi:hypothetical protein
MEILSTFWAATDMAIKTNKPDKKKIFFMIDAGAGVISYKLSFWPATRS